MARKNLGIGDDPYIDVPLFESADEGGRALTSCWACGDIIEAGQGVCDDCLDHDELDEDDE